MKRTTSRSAAWTVLLALAVLLALVLFWARTCNVPAYDDVRPDAPPSAPAS